MRNAINQSSSHDPRIDYRGATASRLDNLTDAVFGIAITLLIFNLNNPNSFADLLTFTKTLPAFLISITFLILIWKEHRRFSEVYGLTDARLIMYNTLFIGLVIFYVYPLRFLTLFLTNFFFQTNIQVSIQGNQVPALMIYYGFIAFALYFTIFLLYNRASKLKKELSFNSYESFYTRCHAERAALMFAVPLISIGVTLIMTPYSFIWASVTGGFTYFLYTPALFLWHRNFARRSEEFTEETIAAEN